MPVSVITSCGSLLLTMFDFNACADDGKAKYRELSKWGAQWQTAHGGEEPTIWLDKVRVTCAPHAELERAAQLILRAMHAGVHRPKRH